MLSKVRYPLLCSILDYLRVIGCIKPIQISLLGFFYRHLLETAFIRPARLKINISYFPCYTYP